MTQQEMFDTIIPALLKQGGPSLGPEAADPESIGCMYRGDDGRKCAVGVLIPDELYTPSMEGRSAEDMMKIYLDVQNLLGAENVEFLEAMQQVHDSNPYDAEEWDMNYFIGSYERLASRFDLNPAVLHNRPAQ